MLALINRIFNKIRIIQKKWNPEKDKKFHDRLFASQHYNPFEFSYFGYITIKRFADLTSTYIQNLNSVLDLGCGPAEITCELARRYPHVSFLGVDHSEYGIDRAKKNAKTLNLKNIEFLTDNIEQFEIKKDTDIILMFDSFHHLLNPHQFIKRMGKSVSNFLLIEPNGDWKGNQIRDFDFDWIMSDLEKIRCKMVMKIQEPVSEPREVSEPEIKNTAEAIENRYNLDEFKKIFKGFGLNIQGTISGLDKYPPEPYIKSRSRDFFGKKAYEIFSELDNMLWQDKIDLLAKHWIIFASKNITGYHYNVPRVESESAFNVEAIKGPYDIEFLEYDGPAEVKNGVEFRAQIHFYNRSFRFLSSYNNENPDLISYHWLNDQGVMILRDGLRTILPRPLKPDEKCKVEMKILSPDEPGKYILALDFVQEGKTWYSEFGSPCMHIHMKIKK